MENQLYLYAIVKTMYEHGEDYIDSFRPYIIKAFPAIGKPVDLKYIQSSLSKNFNLKIPSHTLTTILQRAEKKNYLKIEIKKKRDLEEYNYMLTLEGQEYLDSLEIDAEVKRRLNELVEDLKSFLEEKTGITIESDEVINMFLGFIRKNLEYVTDCFFYNLDLDEEKKTLTLPERHIIEYIETAEQQKPELYKTLRDLVLGSIISIALNFEEFYDKKRKFVNTEIYFDSNLLFYLLDMYYPEFNKPAIELLNLLKQFGFKLKVFDFTLDEMCMLVKGYKHELYSIPYTVRIETIYYRLKQLGWTKNDADKFIETIGDKMSDLGIQIEWVGDINLRDYRPAKAYHRKLITKYKSFQPPTSQNHDLAVIEKISKIRDHPVRKIEDSKALFLTADHALCKFNFLEMDHKNNGTICEVILDKFLTNILWLKNPKTEIPLTGIMAAHSHELFVKRGVWNRFYEIIKSLKQEGKINDDDIIMLFYHNHMENVLLDFSEKEANNITPDFVLDEIEKASKLKEKEEEVRIGRKEREFLDGLGKEILRKAEEEKDKEWSEKIIENEKTIKTNITKSAEIFSQKRSNSYSTAITIFLIILAITFYLKLGNIIITILSFLIGGSGIFGVWRVFREKMKEYIFERTVKIRLEEAGIQERE